MAEHVVVVGNGIAGITAALRVRAKRPDWRVTVVSGESRHHWSRPALMYVFLGHLRYQDTKPFEDDYWVQQRIELIRDWVTEIDCANRHLRLHRGEPLAFDKLLLATGSKPNRFGWPGQDLDGVQGLWGLYDLERLQRTLERVERTVLVGGGLIGVELAEMLLSRGYPVTFLVREESYWNSVLPRKESALVSAEVRRHGVDLRLRSELAEILGDDAGRCRAVRTVDGEEIACELVGLTAGVSPNIDLVRDSAIATQRGILVDAAFATSIDGIYAAGDCAEIALPGRERNLIQQVWYTGKQQGEVVGDVLAGEARTYEPGIWFNSAKFFDLEYQVYGQVGENVVGEQNFYWQQPDAARSLRLVAVEDRVVGINVMGLRFRHEVCERWIAERRSVTYVLQHLAEAHFDAEFSRRHEPQMRRVLMEQVT